MSASPASRRRLCIATLDPLNRGGILALMRFVYDEAAASGFDPYLAYNRVPGIRGEREDGARGVRAESLEDMRGFAVERVLPAFEFLNYVTNRKAWRRILSEGDMFFAIGGNDLPALPFVFARKKFSLWVASTLYEDRIDRMRKQPLMRKVRDYLSLPILLWLEKKVFFRAERIVALSSYTRSEILKKYALSPEKIVVAPYPVDAEFFAPLAAVDVGSGQLSPNGHAPYLLFMGRLEDGRKNIPLALKAFAQLRAQYPELRLKLVGGTLSPESAALLTALDIEGAVEVLPRVPREAMRSLYQHAAVFIIPSLQEGLCITGLEALACGVPVVSTRCGGPEEFVHPGENGALVKNGDVEEFARAIAAILSLPPEQRQEMSRAARRTVTERYVRDKVWPVFQECLTMGGG